jgi:hypothetical protein
MHIEFLNLLKSPQERGLREQEEKIEEMSQFGL